MAIEEQSPEDPWIIEIVLTALDEKDFEVPIKVRQTSSYNTATRSTYTS